MVPTTSRLLIAPAIGVFVLAIGLPSIACAEDAGWPQWRGPTRDGRAEGTWPASLGEDRLKESWRRELGPSYSGPIVTGERVFTTETRDEKTEVTTAYDRATGERLWSTDWPGATTVPFFAAANGSWIRSTPATDGESLYVAGIRDVLVCLDTATGDERWRVDFKREFGTPAPSFGCVSSPLLLGDAIYVQGGGGFVKLDKRSGAVAWRVAADGGGMSGSAFSSPYVAEINGKQLVLLQTRLALKGIDPESGDEAWSQPIEAFRGMNILTPTVYRGDFFTSAHSGRSQLWRLVSSGGLEQVWANKAQAYMSSPVIVGDHLYLHQKNNRIGCLNLATGEEAWRTKPYGKYQSMAVVTCEDGATRVLALDQRGELLLFDATPEAFKPADARKIGESETWAHVAVCGGQVFVRELNALVAYDWR